MLDRTPSRTLFLGLSDVSSAGLEVMLMKMQRDCGNKVFFLIEPSISDPLVKDATIPHMGISIRGIKEGDVICVLLGCQLPIVIRPDGHHYRVVGAAYVDKLADGEAIADLESGFYDLECIELR
jgi:hypothetical protein